MFSLSMRMRLLADFICSSKHFKWLTKCHYAWLMVLLRDESWNTFTLILLRLDIGDGKEVDLEECPRSKLRQQCIKYLGPVCVQNVIYFLNICFELYAAHPIMIVIWVWYLKMWLYITSKFIFHLFLCLSWCNQQEREDYEYLVEEGKIVHKLTGNLLDTRTTPKAKWIFVMSTTKRLHVGEVRIN